MATLTITTTAAQDARIVAAYGDALGLTVPGTNTPRNATAAEVKAAVIDQIRATVRNYEARQNQQTFVAPAIDPT